MVAQHLVLAAVRRSGPPAVCVGLDVAATEESSPLRVTTELARRAEAAGFGRFWVAEHPG